MRGTKIASVVHEFLHIERLPQREAKEARLANVLCDTQMSRQHHREFDLAEEVGKRKPSEAAEDEGAEEARVHRSCEFFWPANHSLDSRKSVSFGHAVARDGTVVTQSPRRSCGTSHVAARGQNAFLVQKEMQA